MLIDHVQHLERATEFADRVNEPEVYSRLAKAFSDAGNVKSSIGMHTLTPCSYSYPCPTPTACTCWRLISVDYFIKANDPDHYRDVIAAAQKALLLSLLLLYLAKSWRSLLSGC